MLTTQSSELTRDRYASGDMTQLETLIDELAVRRYRGFDISLTQIFPREEQYSEHFICAADWCLDWPRKKVNWTAGSHSPVSLQNLYAKRLLVGQ